MSNHYRSYNQLKSESGVLDSYIELFELALRSLPSSTNELASLSDKHEIIINPDSVALNISSCRVMYIVLPISSLDSFITNIRNEIMDYYSYSFVDRDSENKMDGLLRNIKKVNNVYKENNYVYNVLKYYIEVRNCIAHPSSFKKDLDKLLELIKVEEIPTKYLKYKAPNKITNIAFDDFVLCTLLIKDLAFDICERLKPTTEMILSSYIRHREHFNKKASKFLNDNSRYQNSIKMLLKEKYCLDDFEVETVLSMAK